MNAQASIIEFGVMVTLDPARRFPGSSMATQGVRDDVHLKSVEATEPCLTAGGLTRPRQLVGVRHG